MTSSKLTDLPIIDAKQAVMKIIIAERVHWLRTIILKMTQLQLADALGMKHFQTISKYELGKCKPSMPRCNQLLKLAKAAGFETDHTWLRPDLFD
jgi:transcriptional regulator with XRE-family HTH domain